MTAIAYRTEIDGLRAFAVVPVILFHMGFSWIAGGYLGVDVFFVISGFLITSILRKEIADGTFSFWRFWVRRIRRILPALIVVTATTLTANCLFGFKPDNPALGMQAISALLSTANIYFWNVAGNYWGTGAEQSPLLHTWSLSVEEQFYLVFPVILFLISRFRVSHLKYAILIVIVLSYSVFLVGTQLKPTATFYLLPTRVWELAVGCLLAVILYDRPPHDSPGKFSAILASAGLGMVIASFLLLPALNGWSAITVLGTALIIVFGRSPGICHLILTQRPVVHLGKLSYSLYLWHWPVLVFAASTGLGLHKTFFIILVYALSLGSYHFVEIPARQSRAAFASICICFVLTLGLAATVACSFATYDASKFEAAKWSGISCHPYFNPDAYLNGGVILGGGDSDPEIVVLGDSHGVMFSEAIASITERLGIVTSFYCMDGDNTFVKLPLRNNQESWGLSNEQKYSYDRSRIEYIRKWQPRLVIVCARWSRISKSDAVDLFSFLEGSASKVLLIEQPPELAIGDRNATQYLCFKRISPETGVKKYLPFGNVENFENGAQLVRTLANTYKNCELVQTFDLFASDSKALVLDDKRVMYWDDNHLSNWGSQLMIPRFEEAICRAMQSQP
ncbi:MAG TPA: acyltransferase family protein [Planctomycetaceae bacterium]|nr:acyltransferase family protein [Planctomycetaceae bacterium]HQZ63568.1 acyltransferase family protein [Planctomycetaceae bacterium]